MTTSIVETGTITSKGQTTVPKAVRQALGLAPGDRVAYRIVGGEVTLVKAGDGHDDPAIDAFLALLERDIAAGRNVGEMPADLAAALRRYADDADVDPQAPIEGDTAL